MSVPHVSITAGVEVEAGVYKNGKPFDVKKFLAPYGGSLEVPGHGTIGCDLGPNQVEFITGVRRSGDEVENCLRALEGALRGLVPGICVVYESYLPAHYDVTDLLVHPNQHPRAVAQINALHREWVWTMGNAGWKRVSEIARACSTHVHLGICDEYGVFRKHFEPDFFDLYLALRNIHTACGPVYARRLAEHSLTQDHPARQQIWFGCTVRQRRPCKGTWLYGHRGYVERIQSAGPRLVQRGYGAGGAEAWAVDLETPSREADPIVLKTCWDQGRLSPHGTVESRSGKSVPPAYAGWYAQRLIEVSRWTIEWVLQGNRLDSPGEVRRLFHHLHAEVGDFVPALPLTEREWWGLASLWSQ